MNAATYDATDAMARPSSTPSLWIASGISLLFHAVAYALLVLFGSVLSTAPPGLGMQNAGTGLPLQALLEERPRELELPPPLPIELPAPPPAPETVVAPPVPASPPLPIAPPGLTPPGKAGSGLSPTPRPPPPPGGSIAVGTTRELTGFGVEIDARIRTEYPTVPARLPRLHRALTVNYPEWALRDHRSARIEALLLLDAAGKPSEMILVPDDPVFGPAVREALADAAFVPAQGPTAPLPYWIALEFVFDTAPPPVEIAPPAR